MAAMPALRKLLRSLLAILLVPLLLFEEWGWAPLAAQAAKLVRGPETPRLLALAGVVDEIPERTIEEAAAKEPLA